MRTAPGKYRALIQRGKFMVGSAAVVAVIGGAGCGDLMDRRDDGPAPQKKHTAGQAEDRRPGKVANGGLSKKEEKELNQRLEELEDKVAEQEKADSRQGTGSSEANGRSDPSEEQLEDQVRAVAETYYQAAATRNWGYTYSNLDSETRGAFTEDEWFAKNDWLANQGSVTYTIQSVGMDASSPDTLADVAMLLTYEDGSTSIRNTYFVYEDGSWSHRFGQEEYDLFATAGTASASPDGGASPTASPGAAGTKHVKVIISSNVPVDISISDDNLDWLQQEEISGTKVYEHDIAGDSGLAVDAMNHDLRGNVSIQVYENGTLKTQDTDSSGYAQIIY